MRNKADGSKPWQMALGSAAVTEVVQDGSNQDRPQSRVLRSSTSKGCVGTGDRTVQAEAVTTAMNKMEAFGEVLTAGVQGN